MSLYWLHIHEGTEIAGFGPFESKEDFAAFREFYADDAQEDGSRKSVDDLPPLPSGERDDHESDTWVPVSATGLVILEGWPVYEVKRAEAPWVEVGVETGVFLPDLV